MDKLTVKEVKQMLRAHRSLSDTSELARFLGIMLRLIEQQNEQIEDLEDKLVILAEETNVEFF